MSDFVVSVLRIKLGEVLGSRELVCDLLESGSVMMTSLNGLVKIFGIKAYMRSLPFCFLEYAKLFTQSVGSSTLRITPF